MAKTNKEKLSVELVLDNSKFKKELSEVSREAKSLKTDLNFKKETRLKIDSGEVTKASKEVEKLKQDLKSIPKNALSGIGQVGGQLGSLPGAGIVGGAVAGSIGYGVFQGLSGEKARGSFKTRFSGSIEEAEYAITDIEYMMSETGKTFGEIADTYLSLKNAGLEGYDLDKSTKISLGLQEAFGEQGGDLAKAVRSLTSEFGIEGDQALAGIQLLLKEAGNLEGETVDSLWEYAVQQKNLGYDFQESLTKSIQSAKSGIWNVDKLFDFLKESDLKLGEIRTGAATPGQIESLQKLGLTEEDITKTETNREALELIVDRSKKLDLQGVELRSLVSQLAGTQLEDIGGIQKYIESQDIQVTLEPEWSKILNTRILENQFDNLSTKASISARLFELASTKIMGIFGEDEVDRFGGRSVVSYSNSSQQPINITIYTNEVNPELVQKAIKTYSTRTP